MNLKPRALSWRKLSLPRVLWEAVRKGQESRDPERPVVLPPVPVPMSLGKMEVGRHFARSQSLSAVMRFPGGSLFPSRTNTGFSGGSVVKNPMANARDTASVSGSGRSPGEGNDNPFQYSCLENPMDRGVWRATVHGVSKSRTQLSD